MYSYQANRIILDTFSARGLENTSLAILDCYAALGGVF